MSEPPAPKVADGRTPGSAASSRRIWLWIVVLAGAFAFLCKTGLAVKTFGTTDVFLWLEFLAEIRQRGAIGLYHDAPLFNHTPFVIHLLRFLEFLGNQTGLGFPFWVRFSAILADLGSVVLVWKILAGNLGKEFSPAAVALMAASPTSLMISGFHGNTDPVMMFFVLLSLYFLDVRQSAWLGGLALGMSINIKIVPVIFLPAVLLYLRDNRRRAMFAAALTAICFVGWLPYALQDPLFILKRVFGYPSHFARWGTPRALFLVKNIGLDTLPLIKFYVLWGRYFMLGILVALSIWMGLRREKPTLFLQCAVIAFAFLALTPGFGVQYLAWLVPWVVRLGVWPSAAYYTASSIFLYQVYTFWAGGLLWNEADSRKLGYWPGHVIPFEVLCWVVVLAMLFLSLRTVLQSRPSQRHDSR